MVFPTLGEIRLAAFDFAPDGWALCDGRLLPIKDYAPLFSIIGATYGGDGKETFAVPDFRGRAPMHVSARSGSQNQPSYGILGERNGLEEVTLTDSQVPPHTHSVRAFSANSQGTTRNPQNAIFAATAANNAYVVPLPGTPFQTLNPLSITPNVGGQPHGNMQPFTTLNFMICVNGYYPQKGEGEGEIGLFHNVANGGHTTVAAVKTGQTVLKRLFLINIADSPVQLDAPALINEVDVAALPISGTKIVQPNEVSEIAFECTPSEIGGYSLDVTLSAQRVLTQNNPPQTYPPAVIHSFQVQGTTTDSAIGVTTTEGLKINNNGVSWQGFNVQPDTELKISYTITNTAKTGGGNLTVQPPTFANQQAVSSVSSSLTAPQTIPPGGSFNLIVNYKASSIHGTPFSFEVSIVSSATNQSPYVFSVKGSVSVSMDSDLPPGTVAGDNLADPLTGNQTQTEDTTPQVNVPRLVVLEHLPNGSTYTQRPCLANYAQTIEVVVMPPGAMGATVQDPTIANDVTPQNVKGITLSKIGKQALGPEERTTFSVTYFPIQEGDYSFSVNMKNSSSLAPNYSIVISGNAVANAPIMELTTTGGVPIPNGGLNLIPQPINSGQKIRTQYTIKNTGNSTLLLLNYGLKNKSNVGTVSYSPIPFIAPGLSRDLLVDVTPTCSTPPSENATSDFFSVDFSIQTDDASTSPYVFTIGGTVILPKTER